MEEDDPFSCFGGGDDDDNVNDDAVVSTSSAMEEDDPFSCFGGGDGDDSVNNDAVVSTSSAKATPIATSSKPHQHQSTTRTVNPKRSEDCGVLSYHHGTEDSMLAHVTNAVADLVLPPSAKDSSPSAKDGSPEWEGSPSEWEGSAADLASAAVLAAVDEFCQSRHWMMHVGPEKGRVITQVLRDAIRKRDSDSGRTFVCIELGTYCGYSSVLLGRTLREEAAAVAVAGEGATNLQCQLYTVEVNPAYFKISRELIRLARLEDTITLVEIPVEINVMETEDAAAGIVSNRIWADEAKLRRQQHEHDEQRDGLASSLPKIDFLLIDHDKDAYRTDLVRLEREGLVRAGSVVVADNVLFAQIDDYRQYVQSLEKKGVVTTELVMTQIEYADEEILEDDGSKGNDGSGSDAADTDDDLFRDGIEITHYKRNPLADKEDWLDRSAPRFAAMKLREEKAKQLAAVRSKKSMPLTRSARWASDGHTEQLK